MAQAVTGAVGVSSRSKRVKYAASAAEMRSRRRSAVATSAGVTLAPVSICAARSGSTRWRSVASRAPYSACRPACCSLINGYSRVPSGQAGSASVMFQPSARSASTRACSAAATSSSTAKSQPSRGLQPMRRLRGGGPSSPTPSAAGSGGAAGSPASKSTRWSNSQAQSATLRAKRPITDSP